MVRQLRMCAQQSLKSVNQTYMILARLKISNGEDHRRRQAECGAHRTLRGFTGNWPKRGRDPVGKNYNFLVTETIRIRNLASGEFARSEHAGCSLHGTVNCITELP